MSSSLSNGSELPERPCKPGRVMQEAEDPKDGDTPTAFGILCLYVREMQVGMLLRCRFCVAGLINVNGDCCDGKAWHTYPPGVSKFKT